MRHYKNQGILDLFGKRIKKIRETADLSQEQVHYATGISQSHLAQIENGKFNFRISYLALFGEFYGFEAHDLLDHNGPIPEPEELRKTITRFLKKREVNPSFVLKKSITTIFERNLIPSKFLSSARSTKEIADHIYEKYATEYSTTLVSRMLGIFVNRGVIEKLPTDKKSKYRYVKKQ